MCEINSTLKRHPSIIRVIHGKIVLTKRKQWKPGQLVTLKQEHKTQIHVVVYRVTECDYEQCDVCSRRRLQVGLSKYYNLKLCALTNSRLSPHTRLRGVRLVKRIPKEMMG